MRTSIQFLLDTFYKSRKRIVVAQAYVSLRLYGLEILFDDVQAGAYQGRKPIKVDFKSMSDLSGLLELSGECLGNADARRKQVTDKCKTLLTLASVLLAVIGVFLPKSVSGESHWMGIAFMIAIAALLNTLMLLLVFFDIGTESEVSLDQELIDYESDELKKHLVNARLQCASSAQDRTDYLVDVYRTARFFFLFAFALVVVLLFASFWNGPTPSAHEQALHELRGDPGLVELLRGPKGNQGEDAKVNTSAIMTELLQDPRLEQAFDKWAAETTPQADPAIPSIDR